LTVSSSISGILNLSAGGSVVAQSINATGAVTLTVTGAGNSLSVVDVTASGQSVTLNVAGALLDGDSASDNVDITAGSLSVTAGSVGTSGNAVDTEVASLSLNTGTGAAYLSEASALTLSSATSGVLSLSAAGSVAVQTAAASGAVTLSVSSGDLTVGALNAGVQDVTLNVAGALLDGDGASDNVDITAGSLNVTASSVGTSTQALDTEVASLVLNTGTSGAAYLSEASALTLGSANTGILSLSAAGSVVVQTAAAGGAVTLTVAGLGNSLTVGDLIADGQSVTLSVAGALLDGDGAFDNVDIRASSLRLTAVSAGTAERPIDTDVGSLSMVIGSGGAFIEEVDGLTLGDVSAAGDLKLQVLDGDMAFDGNVQMSNSASLSAQALDGAVQQSSRSSIRSEAGDLQIEGKTGASIERASSTTGDVQVRATEGPFVLSADGQGVFYGDQPVRIQGVDVDLGAALAGSGSIEFTSPAQAVSLAGLTLETAVRPIDQGQWQALLSQSPTVAPIVLGDTRGAQIGAPTQGIDSGLYLSLAELGLLQDGFERILLGSQDPRQQIWLTAPVVGGMAQSLVFRDPLVLVASGSARDADGNKIAAGGVFIQGALQGQGLTILGSGSTTHLNAADLRQAGDVLISDSLVVNSDSSIEVTVAGGVLDIRGSILVKSGTTLSLSASQIRLAGFGQAGGFIVLEAGATLVLGTQSLTVDEDLVIDGGGAAHLVLQGTTLAGSVQDFALDQQDLDGLAQQMLDGSFESVRIGTAATTTTVMSPALWAEAAQSLLISGQTVRLGAPGGAASWQIASHSTFVASQGDLELHADLVSNTGAYLALRADQGEVRMASDARIVTPGGLVTIAAAKGIEVGLIDATGGAQGTVLRGSVALNSPQGQITLAGPSDGTMGIRAQSVSIYGYGQSSAQAGSSDQVLRVQADRLQIAAPTGVVSRGMNAEGVYYRLADRSGVYAQVQLAGDVPPQRVMLARDEVASQVSRSATYLAQGGSPSDGFGQLAQSLSSASLSRMAAVDTSVQAQAYLSSMVQPSVQMSFQGRESHWVMLDDEVTDDDLLLSDLAYGLSQDDEPSFVLGLPALQPLSAGLASTSELLFDYETV
jgi:hypothetical protein